MTQVVVTGVGLVTPIGIGASAFWDGLLGGKAAGNEITFFDASAYPVRVAGEITDFKASDFMAGRDAGLSGRFTQLAIAAARLATEEWGEEPPIDPERIGVFIGTGGGGTDGAEQAHAQFLRRGAGRVSPLAIPKIATHAAPATVSVNLKLQGLNYAVTSACASSSHAIGDAVRMIQSGMADMMLAGGTETPVTPIWMSGLAKMNLLSRGGNEGVPTARPFDARRDGFLLSEGAAVLVLERKDVAENRGATVLGEIAGYGTSSDPFTQVHKDPAGAATAMRAALEEAGVEPDDVDYINAHATGSRDGDRVETLAIKSVFGEEAKAIPVSSIKAQTGHPFGASGAIDAATCLLAMRHGIVPSTAHLDEPDPDCDLDYVSDGPRDAKVRVALSNTLAISGHNVSLVIKAA